MPPFAQSMILAESNIELRSAASSITPEFKFILELPSLLAQRNTINRVLQMMGCMVNVPASLVAFLFTVDWITRN